MGIVGGSDLSKITEQLGKTGVYCYFVESISSNSKCIQHLIFAYDTSMQASVVGAQVWIFTRYINTYLNFVPG